MHGRCCSYYCRRHALSDGSSITEEAGVQTRQEVWRDGRMSLELYVLTFRQPEGQQTWRTGELRTCSSTLWQPFREAVSSTDEI